MTTVVQEEAVVDGGGSDWRSRDRQSREWRGLRKFWDEKRNDMGQATIYRFEIISNGSGSFGI
jgi:hypothetical protein